MSSLTVDKKVATGDVLMDCYTQPVSSKIVLRKLDLRLLPVTYTLFSLCSLDRANIGNAKIAGLVIDLRLTGVQFNLCVAILLIPYGLLNVPSNIALKKFGPSAWWLGTILFFWGCIVVSMSFAKNFGGPMTARVFLGAVESGLLPGLTYYLSAWYPKAALGRRIGIVYSASTLANAFAGLLAFAIAKMNGIGGLAGWSWIFLLEGLLTISITPYCTFACMTLIKWAAVIAIITILSAARPREGVYYPCTGFEKSADFSKPPVLPPPSRDHYESWSESLDDTS